MLPNPAQCNHPFLNTIAGGQAGAPPDAPAAVPGRNSVRRGAWRPRRPCQGAHSLFLACPVLVLWWLHLSSCCVSMFACRRACWLACGRVVGPLPAQSCPGPPPSTQPAGGRVLQGGRRPGHAQGAGAHLLCAALHQEDQGWGGVEQGGGGRPGALGACLAGVPADTSPCRGRHIAMAP